MKQAPFDRLSLLFAIIGLLTSIYLTYIHYAGIPAACPVVGVLNCDAVLNSPYAMLFGVPLAAYGLAYFAVYLGLLLFKKYEEVLVWNFLGMGFVLYFWYLEYLIGHICLYCSLVHLCVIILLAFSLLRYRAMGHH